MMEILLRHSGPILSPITLCSIESRKLKWCMTCKPVMVSYEFNSHWQQLYFLKTSMLFLYKNVRFVLFTKISIVF